MPVKPVGLNSLKFAKNKLDMVVQDAPEI